MIHPEPTRREPQNEIIIENMEIVGDEQTETKEKEKEKNKEQEKRESRICSFWIKGKCKFGKDCRSAHPEICKTIMEKGICQEKCDKFHPRMCDEMKRRGVCFRGPKCYYAHFGNINRHTIENETNQRNQQYEQRQNPHTVRRKSMHYPQWQHKDREAHHNYDNHAVGQNAIPQWQQNDREVYHNYDNHAVGQNAIPRWQQNNREAYNNYDNHAARQNAMPNQLGLHNRETYHNNIYMGHDRRSETGKDFHINQQITKYILDKVSETMAERMMMGNLNY